MITFVPLPSFKESARCLDMKRLGNQRSEARGILRILHKGGNRVNHPAVHMWLGYELALCQYYNCIVNEWTGRGYRNNMITVALDNCKIKYPPWVGNDEFHANHRAKLLFKNPDWYEQFEWEEKGVCNLPYIWPTKNDLTLNGVLV